jgi:hypothetical protein
MAREIEDVENVEEIEEIEGVEDVEEIKNVKKKSRQSDIEKLTKFISVNNIADKIDKDILAQLGERVKRQYDEDLQSMKEWADMVDEGLELVKQEFKTKSIPWEGASNFKSPVLSEASISFGNRAKLELLRGDKLVKGAVIGRDPEQQKKNRVDRVTEAMNYQINYQMPDWREDQKRLYYSVPNTGTMFKKTDFNPLELKNESHVIQYPDFVVNQATTSMRTCRSFTILRDFSKDQVERKIRAEIWSDVDIYAADAEGDTGSNEEEGVEKAEENTNRFFEQQTWADLDGDGIEEPYTVTLHEMTSAIVRIVARFDMDSMVVSRNGRVMPLKKMIIGEVRAAAERGLQLPEEPDLSDMQLIRIDPLVNITKYGFIPSPDGTFLDLGYAHLIGAITQAVNTTTNQLVDAGTLRNVGGGFLARNARKKMGPLRMKIGEWISTELSPENLAQGFFPNPQPEPSQVLFALNEKLEQTARQYAAVTDASGAIQPNTAPTTALAIIQENLIPTTALLSFMLDSESKEFQVMFRLNKSFFEPELYREILDEPEASAFADFNSEDMDIKPTASAEMASKLQRIQLATVELEQFDRVVQVGGNAKLILRNFFEAIGTQDVDRIFDDSTMTPEEKQQIEDLQQQQQQLAEQGAQQIELTRAQVALAQGELERLNFRTTAEVDKLIAEAENIVISIDKTKSEIILNLEKAETEQVKNGIDQYTATIRTLTDMSLRIRDSLEARGAQNNAIQQNNTPTRGQRPIQAVA